VHHQPGIGRLPRAALAIVVTDQDEAQRQPTLGGEIDEAFHSPRPLVGADRAKQRDSAPLILGQQHSDRRGRLRRFGHRLDTVRDHLRDHRRKVAPEHRRCPVRRRDHEGSTGQQCGMPATPVGDVDAAEHLLRIETRRAARDVGDAPAIGAGFVLQRDRRARERQVVRRVPIG